MKYLQSVVLLIFISSCCSTKSIVEAPPKKTPEAIFVKDSTIENTKPIAVSFETVETYKDSIPKEDDRNNNFNQILTKQPFEAHELWDKLLAKHVTDDGNINYKSFKKDYKKLLGYLDLLSLSYSIESFNSFSKEEKLAYWINAYNAMTVDLIIRNYPLKSIKDIKDPWSQRNWKLGNKWFNLNEIEHDILRKMDEPRIHFGIVCASLSCPKLQNRAFTADNLNLQLTKATTEFLRDSNRNEISENSLKLSKIFQWFSKDFKQNGSLIDFLNKYSNITISAKAKKSFKDYDWALNE